MSEASDDEKRATVFRHADGSTAHVFSSADSRTVRRHFRWMADYGIGGAMLQRFLAPLKHARIRRFRDRVLQNVRDASAATGTPWALMYDLSGCRAGEPQAALIDDLRRLIRADDFRDDRQYLHHNGKPLLAVWGVGFSDGRAYTLDDCMELVKRLRADDEVGGWSIMLGVPYWWRTRQRDAIRDERLHRLLADVDVISPWAVGRLRTLADVDARAADVLAPDARWAREHDADYLPVIFPGFSWANLQRTVHDREAGVDEIPRRGGEFLWRQAARAMRAADADMLYVAMFDEVDEGTAIFKVTNDPPVGETRFLTYGDVPPDHYLWLTRQIQRALAADDDPPLSMPRRDESGRE